MKILGTYFGSLFLARGPDHSGCADARRIYVWADTGQRTIESAKALAEGMLPGCGVEIHSGPENRADPLFNPLEAGIAKLDFSLAVAAIMGRTSSTLDPVLESQKPNLDLLASILNGDQRAAKSIFDQPLSLTAEGNGMRLTGPLSLASTFSENLLLEYLEGMTGNQLGWGRLDRTKLLQIMTLHTTYADLMRRTPYLAGARGSNLLSRILASIEQAVNHKRVPGALGSPETKVLMLVGHDTNLSNLSGMLHLSWLLPSYQRDDVPPGGSFIFTVWRERGTRYFVGLQFLAQTMEQMRNLEPLSAAHPPASTTLFLPACSAADAGYPCEWRSFAEFARQAVQREFVAR